MHTIFEVFIEFVTILLLFHVLVFWPQGMRDLTYPTWDGAADTIPANVTANGAASTARPIP